MYSKDKKDLADFMNPKGTMINIPEDSHLAHNLLMEIIDGAIGGEGDGMPTSQFGNAESEDGWDLLHFGYIYNFAAMTSSQPQVKLQALWPRMPPNPQSHLWQPVTFVTM